MISPIRGDPFKKKSCVDVGHGPLETEDAGILSPEPVGNDNLDADSNESYVEPEKTEQDRRIEQELQEKVANEMS